MINGDIFVRFLFVFGFPILFANEKLLETAEKDYYFL